MEYEIEMRVNIMCNLGKAIAEREMERGEDRLARLIAVLSEEQNFTMITKVATDSELRKELYKRYGIE